MPTPLPVLLRFATAAELDDLRAGTAASQRSGGSGPRAVDAVTAAWVEMLLGYFGDSDSCFFTGTYRDEYGYPNGLMKPDNVLRDFKRFLVAHNLVNHHWVVCAEPHQERAIWHIHALIADTPADLRRDLESAWTITRGWSSAALLHDGGVSYATKYALKGSDSIMFDWNLT